MKQRLITKELLQRRACRDGVREFFTKIFGPQVALSEKLALILAESEEGFSLLKYAACFALTIRQRIAFRKIYKVGFGLHYHELKEQERKAYACTLAHIFNTYKRR